MLRRLFRSRDRFANADPNVRREAVLALDTAGVRAQGERLARLLADDPDRSVRLAVIERLDAIDTLTRALDDETVAAAAARRIAALAKASGRQLPDHPRLREQGLLQASPAQQQAQIAGIDDPEQLIALALRDRGSLRAAVLAHPALQTLAAQTLLEKRSRGADKSLNRHARETLDRIRRLQHEAATAAERARELVAALGRAATIDDYAAWEREQQLYQQCVAALASYDAARAELLGFGETLADLGDLRARIVTPSPTPPARTPKPSDGPPVGGADAPTAAGAALDETTDAAGPTTATAPSASPPGTADRAQPPVDRAPADARSGEAATAESQAEPEITPAAAAADERAAAQRAARAAAAAARQVVFDAVDALLAAGEEALAAGQVGTARQKLAEAREQVTALPGPAPDDAAPARGIPQGDVPRRLSRRLASLGAAIAELRDWQTFVTAPKREALCDALQALVDQPLAPPDQAERLKSLRAAWRELGPVTGKADIQLAGRFDALAEQAFEPCRAYFAEQAEIRKANLAEREKICAQLASYLAETDWQHADMKAAEQILRTAREAWRQYLPVDRSAGKAVEARFETLQEELHGRIKSFWENNAAAKQQLVAEAEGLASGDGDLQQRIDQVKGLQQRWKTIGPAMPRARDQALWSAFRSACDSLFAARDAARSTAESELRQLAGQCAAALDEFEGALATLTPEAATEAQARDLRDRLRALDGLPPPLRQPLAARRSALLTRHQAILQERGRAARRARIAELRDRDAAFSRAEIAHREGAPAPELSEACFAPRRGSHAEPVPLDALRRLTLRAEQAAGIAPPPEDESLRLEVQVERLRAGLAGTEDEAPLALAERWCGIGPKDASVDPLRERFFAALAARLDG